MEDIDKIILDFYGETLLVEEAQSIIEAKKEMLDFLLNRAKIMDETRTIQKEKLIRDFEYLKKEYNLE